MNSVPILYLCSQEEENFLQVLSSHYTIYVYHVGSDKEELENYTWKLVICQDADAWSKRLLRNLRKVPWIFVSTRKDIKGYIAPAENLFGVINMSGADLSLWGIPKELQTHLQGPVKKTADHYFFEQEPETCRIVYCPTGNNIYENDFKLLTFLCKTNAKLIIVSEQYEALANAFPSFVKIISPKTKLTAFQTAHAVIASGHDAVSAMALGKPCVILGNYGLGGIVTPENYEQLRAMDFTGRYGASCGEMVPIDLLEAEITKIFLMEHRENVEILRKKVWESYGIRKFTSKLQQEIDRVLRLHDMMKDKKKRMELKPYLSSAFHLEILQDKQYIMRSMRYICESDEELTALLKQCNGKTSISDLIVQNGYGKDETSVIWENIYELWKEKLILFNL